MLWPDVIGNAPFWPNLPLVWRRHPTAPLIQSLPMTQTTTPPNHPSPSRQLAPFQLSVTAGCDLLLLSGATAADLPALGRDLIVVADISGTLHLRIYGLVKGTPPLVDSDEGPFAAQSADNAKRIADLKTRLAALFSSCMC